MQQVSAFLPPQTVPTVPARTPRNLWILSSWRDLVLYVGTPLLLIPLYALARGHWSAQDIYLFVGAFGATGHHLPGMIRAYGDHALFERFKWRFIFAPIFLAGVCISFYLWDLKGIVLILFFWGVWHGMMQTYGFCRIYDAKTGTFAALNRRLDFALCGSWFAAAVFLSPERLGETLKGYYACGGPFIEPWVLRALQQSLLGMAIAVLIGFVLNYLWMWRRGAQPNPVKVALLVTSISFWWYCNNGVTNILAGIALFEVFHDVQYLSIVWIYNRNRVEKDKTLGGFMKFVFRRSGSLIGLYVGLVFAYGSFAYLNSQLEVDNVKRLLTGLVAASGLLHFYYDGFIWKVRETSTRQSLGLGAGTADVVPRGVWPGWALHGAKWAAGFVFPVALLCLWQLRGPASDVARYRQVVADVPNGITFHYDYGVALEEAGQSDEAMQQLQFALAHGLDTGDLHYHLGRVLSGDAKFDPALAEFEKAIQREPKSGEFRFRYGETLQRVGRGDEAATEYQEAARLTPKVATPRFAYADLMSSQGKLDEAISAYQAGLKLKPTEVSGHFRIARTLEAAGRFDEATRDYQEALRLDPKLVAARSNLGRIYVKQRRFSQAAVEFGEAARLAPDNEEIAQNLRAARAAADSGVTSTP
ncbi:MAG TPA: tetratricopeptide repeat protein [Chthoniobacterales bacterium]